MVICDIADHLEIHMIFIDYFFISLAINDYEVHFGAKHRFYPCTICEKPFYIAEHFEIHMHGHIGEKPYTCNKSGKAFTIKLNVESES